jgi:hypothetical protein
MLLKRRNLCRFLLSRGWAKSIGGVDPSKHVERERGLMGLMADLGGGPVGVDTAVFIYFIEEHPQFLPLVEPFSEK